jgi:integrase
MAQKKRSRGRDLDYWKQRLIRREFVHAGEVRESKDWSVRIQHAGRRQFFNLGTSNKEAAGAKARKIADFVKAHGWEAAEAEFKHAEEKARIRESFGAASVGEYLKAVTELATDQRPRTLAAYASSLRRVAGEILRKGSSRPSRAKIDALPLSALSDDQIEKWKSARLKACAGNPVAEDTAKITANSILRNCRAAFGRKLLTEGRKEVLRKGGMVLPEPLPFSKCSLFEEDTSGKFSHDVAVGDLVRAASNELAGNRREGEPTWEFEARRQSFLAFLLVFAAGLRKGEADTLEWSAIDLDSGTLAVRTTQHFRPKTKASQRPVRLDPETVEILRQYRAQYRQDHFVLRGKGVPQPAGKHAHYRCDPIWRDLSEWLAEKGVRNQKPIHYLRKASAAFVARKFGIFAAQRHARHTTPTVTQRYYSDSDETVAPGFGEMFGERSP